jgi:hypothetical protein
MHSWQGLQFVRGVNFTQPVALATFFQGLQ